MPAGRRLDSYRFVDTIRTGVCWKEHRAIHETQRPVLLHEFDLTASVYHAIGEAGDRLVNAARLLARDRSRRLPQILDAFWEGNTGYIAYAERPEPSLLSYVQERRLLSEGEAQGFAWQAMALMKALHQLEPPPHLGGLPPDAVLVGGAGALILPVYPPSLFLVPGTWPSLWALRRPYAAPEVLAGWRCTVESDMFALGALLYFGVTKQAPVREAGAFRAPEQFNPQIDAKLNLVILRCLEYAQDRRFSGIQELADRMSGMLAWEDARGVPRVVASIRELVVPLASSGVVLGGTFQVQALDERPVRGTLESTVPWLLLNPREFSSPGETIRYWIDTSWIRVGRPAKGAIRLSTPYQRLEVPVKVTAAPGTGLRHPRLTGLVRGLLPLGVLLAVMVMRGRLEEIGEGIRQILLQVQGMLGFAEDGLAGALGIGALRAAQGAAAFLMFGWGMLMEWGYQRVKPGVRREVWIVVPHTVLLVLPTLLALGLLQAAEDALARVELLPAALAGVVTCILFIRLREPWLPEQWRARPDRILRSAWIMAALFAAFTALCLWH